MILRGRCDFVVDLVDRLGGPADRIGGSRHVDGQRIADRLAHVQGFEQCQLFLVCKDQVGKGDQDALALGGCQVRPDAGLEGTASNLHRDFGVGGVSAGDLGQEAAIDRAQAVERRAVGSCTVLAVDKCPTFDFQGLEVLLPVVAIFSH
ncbi:hypothetical protein D3C81_1692090 [compost metagenome]